MKKVLALVLAVMMLCTMAFAVGIGNTSNPADTTVDTEGNKISIQGGKFMPGGKIYVYKLDTATDEDVKEVNSDNYSITKVKYDEGRSLVEDIYFDDDNDQAIIKLADNDNLTTTKTLKMSFVLNGKGRNTTDVEVTIDTTVGYRLLEKAYLINDTDDVEFNPGHTSPNNQPYTEGLFYEVVDNGAAYGELEFNTADNDVEGVVRVYDGDELYLYSDAKADTDILKAYADSDADMTFLNFPNTTFNSTATLYIYKDEDSFIYEVKNGKLVESNARWDDDEGCFVLRARTLGSYVFSDVELDVTEDVDDTVENPDTGANDVVGIAAALGVVALVSAAAVSLKK